MKIVKKLLKYLWIAVKYFFIILFSITLLIIIIYYINLKAHDGYVITSDGKPVANVSVNIYCGIHDLFSFDTDDTTKTDSDGYYVFSLPAQECENGHNERTVVKGQNFHTISTKEITFYQRDFIVEPFSKADYDKIKKEKQEKDEAIKVENLKFKKLNDKFTKKVEEYVETAIDTESWYKIMYADINADRLHEAFIYMVGKRYCLKSYNCSMEVIAEEKGKLVRVGWYDDVTKDKDFYIDTSYNSTTRKYKSIATKFMPIQHIKMRFEGKLTPSKNKKSPSKQREELSLRVQKFVEDSVATEIYLNRGYTLTFMGEEPNITIFVHLTHPTHDGRIFALRDTKKDGLTHKATHLNNSTNKTFIIKDIDSSFGFSKVVTPIYFHEDKKYISRYEVYYRDDLDREYEYYPNDTEFDEIEKELKERDDLVLF